MIRLVTLIIFEPLNKPETAALFPYVEFVPHSNHALVTGNVFATIIPLSKALLPVIKVAGSVATLGGRITSVFVL